MGSRTPLYATANSPTDTIYSQTGLPEQIRTLTFLFGQKCPIIMKGTELIRKLEKLAKKRHQQVRFIAFRGKGSHGTLFFGDRRTIIPDLSRELKKGTYHAILKQLGLTPEDLE